MDVPYLVRWGKSAKKHSLVFVGAPANHTINTQHTTAERERSRNRLECCLCKIILSYLKSAKSRNC
jgi:hypothetical protein